jgi:hypothetical protein
MHIRALCLLLILLLTATPTLAAPAKGKAGKKNAAPRVFDGYAGMKWGTDAHTILRNYPGVAPSKEGAEFVLRQKNPNREMGQRSFIFRDNKLVAVTVKFNPSYVKRTGVEKLLESHRQFYGKGTMDRAATSHMLSYIWESPRTRITYAYSPKYPEMTAVLFQLKDKESASRPKSPDKAAPAPPAASQPKPAAATPSLPAGHPPITGSKPIPAGPLNLPKGHPPIPGQSQQK